MFLNAYVCTHLYVCVYIAVMHTCTCAHLLTRPILSVNPSESRILKERLISGGAVVAHAHWSLHVCVCAACAHAASGRVCV